MNRFDGLVYDLFYDRLKNIKNFFDEENNETVKQALTGRREILGLPYETSVLLSLFEKPESEFVDEVAKTRRTDLKSNRKVQMFLSEVEQKQGKELLKEMLEQSNGENMNIFHLLIRAARSPISTKTLDRFNMIVDTILKVGGDDLLRKLLLQRHGWKGEGRPGEDCLTFAVSCEMATEYSALLATAILDAIIKIGGRELFEKCISGTGDGNILMLACKYNTTARFASSLIDKILEVSGRDFLKGSLQQQTDDDRGNTALMNACDDMTGGSPPPSADVMQILLDTIEDEFGEEFLKEQLRKTNKNQNTAHFLTFVNAKDLDTIRVILGKFFSVDRAFAIEMLEKRSAQHQFGISIFSMLLSNRFIGRQPEARSFVLSLLHYFGHNLSSELHLLGSPQHLKEKYDFVFDEKSFKPDASVIPSIKAQCMKRRVSKTQS